MKAELINEVTKVEAHVHRTNPPRLHVTVTGTSSSGGHTNPRLERRVYIVFPEDGIQEYDYKIDAPEGPSTTDVKEHIVEDIWDGFPQELKGVRVYAKNNHIERNI